MGKRANIREYIDYDLWRKNAAEMGKLHRFGVRLMRTIVLVIRSFGSKALSVRADHLTYSLLFAIVPILAMVCGAMGDKLAPIGGTPTVLIGVAIAASSAMILPISTPPNALSFATGYVKQNDMAKIGIIMGIVSIALGFGLVYMMGTLHLI